MPVLFQNQHTFNLFDILLIYLENICHAAKIYICFAKKLLPAGRFAVDELMHRQCNKSDESAYYHLINMN